MDEKKLIEIYEDSSNFLYKYNIGLNQKSKHWKTYDLKKFNLENLINFRNYGKLSEGLDDQSDTFPFKIYSEIVNKTSEEYVLNNLPKKNIGNSDAAIPYKNVFIDFNKLIHIYWFWILENKILKNNKITNVCEIGGGFGSFVELFIRNYNTKVFLIDLPEANLLSTYYLKKFFPQKSFYLFNDYKNNEFLSKSDFEKNDIIILPPNCNIDKKIKIDFFINTRSMMEMEYDVIKSYFGLVQEHSIDGGYFLNVNRYEKTSVGYPIRISEYPYDDNWKVIMSEPSFNQNWIHFLLTQRTFIKNEKDIIQELAKISVLGKKFYITHVNYRSKFKILKRNLKKIIKIIFGVKFINSVGNFLFKISYKLKNFK